MNTKQLQYFLATAENKSITAAAKMLDIAQPAISLQIANLEHELKIKLFDRDFRGVTLTEAGCKFKKHAKQILLQIQDAKAEIAQGQQTYSGKVVVGLSQSICNVLSVELLNELEQRYANIELTFRVGPSYVVDSWLHEKKIDIALCYELSRQVSMDLNVVELIREDLFLYISNKPQNPAYSELAIYSSLPFSDLQYYKIFMPDKKDALSKSLMKTADALNIQLKTKDAFGQMMTTLHFVTQGLGLVVCPSSSTFHLEQTRQIRGIKIIEPDVQQNLYLVRENKIEENCAVSAVFELIREVTASVHAKNYWRGTLIDKKYYVPDVNNIETLIEG
jgi:LysR family transcriptional regulator, nitrogen assimilation regulatory protein